MQSREQENERELNGVPSMRIKLEEILCYVEKKALSTNGSEMCKISIDITLKTSNLLLHFSSRCMIKEIGTFS